MSEADNTWVLVGLGANLGQAEQTVRQAMRLLRARHGKVVWRASDLWRSLPVDCAPGDGDFVNAVVAFPATDQLRAAGAPALLAELQALEQDAGRPAQRARNAPRSLDLDLLLFADAHYCTPICTVPHPRALQRRFVLEPAAQILPDLHWPGTSATLAELADSCRQAHPDQLVERLAAV